MATRKRLFVLTMFNCLDYTH